MEGSSTKFDHVPQDRCCILSLQNFIVACRNKLILDGEGNSLKVYVIVQDWKDSFQLKQL